MEHTSGILSDQQILEYKDLGYVVIHPFYLDQLGNCSYDVTLGNYYYTRTNKLKYFNPWNPQHLNDYWNEARQALLIEDQKDADLYGCQVGDKIIILGPDETILAHTNEFIGGVDIVTTKMQARSSIGRCCIKVCSCAGQGDIGYTNRWTMEINNSSNTNLVLIVGQKMAQIVFETTGKCNSSYEAHGSYQHVLARDLNSMIQSWKPEMMLPKLTFIKSREYQAEQNCH